MIPAEKEEDEICGFCKADIFRPILLLLEGNNRKKGTVSDTL